MRGADNPARRANGAGALRARRCNPASGFPGMLNVYDCLTSSEAGLRRAEGEAWKWLGSIGHAEGRLFLAHSSDTKWAFARAESSDSWCLGPSEPLQRPSKKAVKQRFITRGPTHRGYVAEKQ